MNESAVAIDPVCVRTIDEASAVPPPIASGTRVEATFSIGCVPSLTVINHDGQRRFTQVATPSKKEDGHRRRSPMPVPRLCVNAVSP